MAQNNDPRTRLMPSATYVARDFALSIVFGLQQLLADDEELFDTFMALVNNGPWPALTSGQWMYLLNQNLIRREGMVEEAVRDIARMAVSGTPGSWTINPEVF